MHKHSYKIKDEYYIYNAKPVLYVRWQLHYPNHNFLILTTLLSYNSTLEIADTMNNTTSTAISRHNNIWTHCRRTRVCFPPVLLYLNEQHIEFVYIYFSTLHRLNVSVCSTLSYYSSNHPPKPFNIHVYTYTRMPLQCSFCTPPKFCKKICCTRI